MHRVASTGNAANSSRPRKEKRLTYVFSDSDDSKHCSGVNCVKFSSSADGSDEKKFLFSGSRDGTIKRWEVDDEVATCCTTFESHVDWVNDVVLTGTDTLVSCSSDTTLKTWNAFSNGACTRTFRQHSDYVTSLASARQSNIVASGGLGCEVFIWDLEAAMVPVCKAPTESNYDDNNRYEGSGKSFTSGVIYNERCTTANTAASLVAAAPSVTTLQGYSPVPAKGHKESVYALAINDAGNVLVSGGTEKAVRVWDPRTGAKQMKLKGHTDNVRTLLLDPSGRLCLSGSSDSMIRLWDLGQQRCIHSYAVHTDSVWSMASTSSFSHVYSGGKDLSVYLTDLASRESILLFTEKHPTLQLALQEDDWLWVATTDSAINRWPARERISVKALQKANSFVAGSLPFARARAWLDVSAPAPLYTQPTSVIPGTAGIVRHSILNDRRHVLTKDTSGSVKLWEITRGAVAEDFGEVSFEEKEKELFEMVSVPAWFTMDTRLGSISVHLDMPQCFSAEIYSVDLQVQGATEESKLNLGQETLRGLLSHWVSRRKQKSSTTSTSALTQLHHLSNGGDALPQSASAAEQQHHHHHHHPHHPYLHHRTIEATSLLQHHHHDDSSSSSPSTSAAPTSSLSSSSSVAASSSSAAGAVLPAFEFSTVLPPSIITEGSQSGPWRRKVTDLDGSEDEKDLPKWCIDCVLHNQVPPREHSKCSFFLHPYEGTSLQGLTQGKLSAPRILRIQKVINYVLEKLVLDRSLEENGSMMDSSNGNNNNTPQMPGNVYGSYRQSNSSTPTLQHRPWHKSNIEILCNQQVLAPDLSLATVRTYIWKKPVDDLILYYRTVQK